MNPPFQPLPCCARGAARRGRAIGGWRERREARPRATRRTPAAEHGEDPTFPRRPARGLKPLARRGETSEARWGGSCRWVRQKWTEGGHWPLTIVVADCW